MKPYMDAPLDLFGYHNTLSLAYKTNPQVFCIRKGRCETQATDFDQHELTSMMRLTDLCEAALVPGSSTVL